MRAIGAIFLAIAILSLVGSLEARAQEFPGLRNDLPLSSLFLVPNPTDKDDARNHGIVLPEPVTISITAPLPKPAHKAGLDVIYFHHGKATSTEPGWTSYCQLARPSNQAPDKPLLSVEGTQITHVCWGSHMIRTNQIGSPIGHGRGGAPGEDERLDSNSLVDLRLGEEGVWTIECHNMSISATVGDLKGIFGNGVSITKGNAGNNAVQFESAHPTPKKAAAPSSAQAPTPKAPEPVTTTPAPDVATSPPTEAPPLEIAPPPLLPATPPPASGVQFK